jgi:hypothetical protein
MGKLMHMLSNAQKKLMRMLRVRISIKRLEHARKEVNIFNNFLTT